MGKYAATSSFLVPQYGTGELCQAFCRMAAVFGGTVMLSANVESVDFTGDTKNVKIDGKVISTPNLVAEGSYISNDEPEVAFYTTLLITAEENWLNVLDLAAKLEIIGDNEEADKVQTHNFVFRLGF